MKKIKCNNINYRKGFIEISENIHKGYINIEMWSIDPDADISTFEDIPESSFTGNTELELSLENAEELLEILEGIIFKIKHDKMLTHRKRRKK